MQKEPICEFQKSFSLTSFLQSLKTNIFKIMLSPYLLVAVLVFHWCPGSSLAAVSRSCSLVVEHGLLTAGVSLVDHELLTAGVSLVDHGLLTSGVSPVDHGLLTCRGFPCGPWTPHCRGFPCGPWTPHCRGFSCCGAGTLDSKHSVAVVLGPSCSTLYGIFPDQGLNPRLLRWQADS